MIKLIAMKINSLLQSEKKKVEMEGAEGAFKQIPVSKADGTPNFSLRVFTLKPGGHTPFHQHPYEHVNYIIEGEGTIKKEDGSFQQVKKGDFVLVMPNEKHQYANASGSSDFVMICGVPREFE